jgi:hypothetical protein
MLKGAAIVQNSGNNHILLFCDAPFEAGKRRFTYNSCDLPIAMDFPFDS